MAFERNGEFVTRGSQPTLCHGKLVGLSYLGRRQRSRHVLSTGITRGSGELRLLQSVPSSSRSASTSTASSTPGPADVPKRLRLFDINYSLCCFFQGFSKQDCHCYLHLGWLHVSCLRDGERAQRLARPAAHSAARQERQRGREATGAELRAHVERHGQGVHSWREQLHPGGPPERPATSLRDPKLCEVLPGRLRPLCRVPPRVFALLCPQRPALQTRDRSQFSLWLWSAPHRLWPSWGVSVPPPDDGQGDGELEEQGALPEILWFPKSLLIAERGAASRRKSNAAPEERSAKHGTQPDDLGTSVGGRRQAWSGDSWARDEATKTALREVISNPTLCSSELMNCWRYGSYSTSPNTNPLSPTSPVGSVSAGLSRCFGISYHDIIHEARSHPYSQLPNCSDGTGSSNSINDPYLGNGEHEHSNLNSYQPDVIPEESSGEISIEFNPKAEGGSSSSNIVNQTLPRCQPARLHHHQKQASLSDFSYDDYMDMGGPPPKPSNAAPPLPKRNNEQTSNSLSQLPNRSLPLGSNKELAGGSAKKDLGTSSTEYHVMSPISTGPSPATPQISPTEGIYFDMDRLNLHESSTSTPLKSTSSITLVPAETFEATHLPARTPPVAIKTPSAPQTILTPPDGGGVKLRRPSGDGGYVIMSPGVSNNIGLESSIMEEPSSLAMLEESLGSSTGWRSSPRHASPSARTREKSSRPNSKRNSSCLDEAEAHWPIWRYETEPLDCSTDDIYQPVNYPVRGARPTPGPMSRVSPASSSSAVSGTPSSDSRFTDFHMMEKVSSYLREDEDEEDRLSKRPPHGRKSVHTPKYMEIPSSKSSSRSNVSPFGRTPPTGASNSPTVSFRLLSQDVPQI